MTQEDKDLLLIDLSARLPHGVILDNGVELRSIDVLTKTISGNGTDRNITHVKPYLRPMKSMTDEAMEDYARYKFKEDPIWEIVGFKRTGKGFININCINKINGTSQWIFQVNQKSPLENYKGIDWLNAHHFDYRGLIEKGLALEAPEGMYKNNKKEQIQNFFSVYSREEIEEIDGQIMDKTKEYEAKMRDANMKAKDFPITN